MSPTAKTFGISTGAIVLDGEQRLLMVHHDFGSHDFWVPPGGKANWGEASQDCAVRETLEETGITITPQKLLYIQEIVEVDLHFMKLWWLCEAEPQEPTVANTVEGEEFLTEACFLSREELSPLTVYPEVLRDEFWTDLANGLPETRYLGLSVARE